LAVVGFLLIHVPHVQQEILETHTHSAHYPPIAVNCWDYIHRPARDLYLW